MAVEVPHNKGISAGGKNGGRKEISLLFIGEERIRGV